MRHRFGTLVCRAGGIRVTQEALGHALPTSTAIYTAVARREIRHGPPGRPRLRDRARNQDRYRRHRARHQGAQGVRHAPFACPVPRGQLPSRGQLHNCPQASGQLRAVAPLGGRMSRSEAQCNCPECSGQAGQFPPLQLPCPHPKDVVRGGGSAGGAAGQVTYAKATVRVPREGMPRWDDFTVSYLPHAGFWCTCPAARNCTHIRTLRAQLEA